MTSTLANTLPLDWEVDATDPGGAQTLLAPDRGKPPILLQTTGAAGYLLLLVAIVSLSLHRPEPYVEEPLELVMAPPEAPPEEEPPPPPEELEEEPPPPIAEEPEPIAPVEPKPEPPKKVPPKNVVKAPVPTPGPAQPPPPGAVQSNYANQIYAKVSRTAATPSARAAISRGEKGRVAYRLVIGPSGQLLSKSISPSGNATFDAAASDALARAAPFPPTNFPKPVSISGAIVYR
jgi:protein TonB